jgi:hypothetical protein
VRFNESLGEIEEATDADNERSARGGLKKARLRSVVII